MGADVLDGGDGRLNDEEVGPRFLGDLREFLGARRNRRYGGAHFPRLDLFDALGDQLFLDRLHI